MKSDNISNIDCDMIFSQYQDLNGNLVKRTPYSHPYAYDAYVLYKAPNFKMHDEGQNCNYHDRLLQWDSKKYFHIRDTYFTREASPNHYGDYLFRGIEEAQKFLRLYYDDSSIVVTAITEGANQATGYPVWCLFFKKNS